MANRLQRSAWTIALAAHCHSESLTNLFQLLLLLAVFEPMFPILAKVALIVALLLAMAQILCNFPGRYLYRFPGEMHK